MVTLTTAFLKQELISARPQTTLLDFSFTTEEGEIVSFTLDTSVRLKKSFYPKAVSELKVNGFLNRGKFHLWRWDESALTFWGVHWWTGGMYLEFAKPLTEQLSTELEMYRSFTPSPEAYLWGTRNDCFRKDAHITNLRVKHHITSRTGLWNHLWTSKGT